MSANLLPTFCWAVVESSKGLYELHECHEYENGSCGFDPIPGSLTPHQRLLATLCERHNRVLDKLTAFGEGRHRG
jgi:hypothetical protein